MPLLAQSAGALPADVQRAAAQVLADWFEVFSAHYLATRRGLPLDTGSAAHQRLLGLGGAEGL